MRTALGALGAAIAIVAVSAGAVSAQSADPLPLRIEEVDASDHPAVSIVVSVPSELVGVSLTSENFTVIEAGEDRPSGATAVPTDGLQVILLLDTSGSMKGRPISAAKAAAQGFLDAMPAGVAVAVVSFGDEPTVLSPFGEDTSRAGAEIAKIEAGSNTALYDALEAGAGLFEGEASDRRILVVLSDGGDTASSSTLTDAIDAISGADVGFYVVELESPENDADTLGQLVTATGGQIVPAEDPEALAIVFDDIASQIVNQYELRYRSEASGETVVDVTVEADGVLAAATTRTEFPAPPPVSVPPTEPTPETTIVVEALAPTPRAGSVVTVGIMQSSGALWGGMAAVFLGLLVLLLLMGLGRSKKQTLVSPGTRQQIDESRKRALTSLSEQVTVLAERALNRGAGATGPVTTLLEQAGIQLRPGELIIMSAAAALVVAVVTMLLSNAWLALLAGVMTLLAIRAWLRRQASKRRKEFAEQLPDLLQLMSGSIRSGFGMMQAMDAVAREMPPPAGEEFQRVKTEVQLGRDLNDSLQAMAERVGSEDFQWVVEAIQIHNEVGGDLADILDSVLGTVRDRIRVRRRIQTLSAEGRMSGLVLALLPFVLVLALVFFSPGYINVLFTTQVGRMLVLFGLVLMGIGALWIRRITTLKF
jgi:tight adherence protein B